MLSPKTRRATRVSRINDDDVVEFTDGSSCFLREVEWEHVQPPELGFRHSVGGKALYYITRRPVRQRSKGITPSAIEIAVPPIVRECATMLGNTVLSTLTETLAASIFDPVFKTLPRAITSLRSTAGSVGFALSHYWGVSIGLEKPKAFVLYYKGLPAAYSQDGVAWEFVDSDSERVFAREFPCL